MKVLLLRANPRKIGYSQRLADWFLQGLRESGAEVVEVDLTQLTITPCDGCFHCWLATPGQCVHHDDMTPLLRQVLEAEVLVCVTPLYYYCMSSCLKAFFERTFPLAKPGLVASRRGFARNSTRYPEQWIGKTLITIVSGAMRDMELFRPVNETLQLIADTLDLKPGGQLTRPESYLLDYPLSKPKTLKLVEAAFIQAGREAGRTGCLTEETIAAASAPLAADEDHFRVYSNIYWDRAADMGLKAMTPSEVQRQVGADVRILMREMARYLDAKATARVRAVLQFEFPDQQLVFSIKIDRGNCWLSEAAALNPDLRIQCDSGVWAGIFMRQLDAREALTDRRLILTGDKSLFARLDRFFPPPSV